MPGYTTSLHLPYPTSSEAPDAPAQIKALADALDGQTAGSQGLFIIGEIRLLPLVSVPTGWLPCDGAAVSRTTYSKLFAAIATAFGTGDGSTTFNVPDTRGRALVGAGAGVGLTARSIGTKWGVEAVVLTTAQIPAHNHTEVAAGSHSHGVSGSFPYSPYGSAVGDSGYALASNAGGYAVGGVTGGTDTGGSHSHSINNTGGGGSHENAPPSLAVPVFIYAGV